MELPRALTVAIIRPGYPMPGWRRLPFDATSGRVRARVGINHLPLSALLNVVVRHALTLDRIEEPGGADPPIYLAFSLAFSAVKGSHAS
jgi:hypothetical protein